MNLGFGPKKPNFGKHADALSNVREKKEGWKFAALILGAVSTILAFVILENTGETVPVLTPYHISAAPGAMPYNLENLTQSQRYLSLLARSDLTNLLIWQPDTIYPQFGAFLRRCTPEAYQTYNLRLMKEAKRFKNLNVTEMFFPQGEAFVPPDSVALSGMLIRKMGHETLFRKRVKYVVSYAADNGIFAIAAVHAYLPGTTLPRSLLHAQ